MHFMFCTDWLLLSILNQTRYLHIYRNTSKELLCTWFFQVHDRTAVEPDGNIATNVTESVHTSAVKSVEDSLLADPKRQYDWEKGQIDYMGMDCFENILKQLDDKINGGETNKTKDDKIKGEEASKTKETKAEVKQLH